MPKSLNITEKMVLGTAQFGMDYGIANISGKPKKKEVFGILDLAWENGIRRFDTAPNYGSEELLGEFILANGIQDEAIVLTKISSLDGVSDYQQRIRTSLESSLKNLGCPVDVLFLHNPVDSDLLLKNPQFFENLTYNYPISKLGVSIYEPQEVEYLSGCPFELAFQFPFNVLDRRFEKVKMYQGMRYARSIFLQGILASKSSLIENAPEPLLNIQMNYHSLLDERGIDPIDLAVSFVFYAKNVDYFLIGVDTLNQLNEVFNIEIDELNKQKDIDPIQFEFDSKWLNPREWK